MPPYNVSEPIQIVLLAILQGIAEFLPISSSGHLVILNALFGTEPEKVLGLGIVLHLGTLLAILLFYRVQIFDLLRADKRVIPLLIVGTLPAVVVGLYLKKYHEWITTHPLIAGFMLPLTGFMLIALASKAQGSKAQGSDLKTRDSKTDSAQTPANGETAVAPHLEPPTDRGTSYRDIGYFAAFLIGCAQAFAILPGISRSGSTIVAGVFLGLSRQSAATFSFLLAIPAIAGASLLELIDIVQAPGDPNATPIYLLVVGLILSFLVGLASLHWLVKWLEQGKLHVFAYWVIPLGFLVVVWQLYVYVQNGGWAN